MLTVACVLRSSPDFNREYVERLWTGVTENLKTPHKFLCLSDADVPCLRLPLTEGWGRWWAKIELFKLPPPVLYFDLDTIIVGDLREIAAHAERSPFTTLRDFYRSNGIGSGMMSWSEDLRGLFDTFSRDPVFWQKKAGSRGDQNFIEEQVSHTIKWQDALPGQVVSYKGHVKENGVPDGARAVCFHGKPRPRDMSWKL